MKAALTGPLITLGRNRPGSIDGRMGLLQRTGKKCVVFEFPEFAAIRERLRARPGFTDNIRPLVIALGIFRFVHPKNFMRVFQKASADAVLQAATGEHIQHGILFGQPDRVIKRHQGDAGPESNAFGPAGGRHGDDRRRPERIARVVVLAKPDRVKAEFFFQFDLFQNLVIILLSRAVDVRVIVGIVENSEFHAPSFSSTTLTLALSLKGRGEKGYSQPARTICPGRAPECSP